MNKFDELVQYFDIIPEHFSPIVPGASVILAAVLSHLILKYIILKTIHKIVSSGGLDWAKTLVSRKITKHFLLIIPALVVYAYSDKFGSLTPVISKIAAIYIIISVLRGGTEILNWVTNHFQSQPEFKHIPIKGYVQVATIVIYLISLILIVSTITSTNPKALLAGLGALSAILLLVFKDSILGFIASIQISTNDLCRRGDWVEFPRYKSDGEVLEVSLYTVKVQNWDMTISNIPTIAFVTDSFKNWRGMEESGGRRIKRSIHIDIGTIKFCNDALIEKFLGSSIIADYMKYKVENINNSRKNNDKESIPLRELTNVGTFRAYIEHYLKKHPKIHQSMTLLVRQQPATERGLPIEVYVFCNDTNWKNYEGIQADIFDHIFAVAKEFELSIFQSPSNLDIKNLSGNSANHL
ncbi:MAG: mechanosensitive ion channel [Pseudomonadales bacterium]|nr:mechanosensitive ion channel [Pseudomonadales bacterium]